MRFAVGVVLLAVAMGVLNTTVAQVAGQSVNLGFVTGDLKSLGEHLAKALSRTPIRDSQGPWDTHLSRAVTVSAVWAAFFCGAVLGTGAASHFATWTLVVPAVVLLVIAAIERRSARAGTSHTRV